MMAVTSKAKLEPSQVKQYFIRLGLDPEAAYEPTLKTLTRILNRHIKSIPFGGLNLNYFTRQESPLSPVVNTLDPNSTRGVNVDPEVIFKKLVVAGREGYCFEHATLLRSILESLGFTAFATCARVLDPLMLQKGEHVYGDITHCVLIATIQSRQYLVDAGFSHFSTFRPVPLDGEVVECEGLTDYRIVSDPYIDPTHPHPGSTIPGFRLESRIKRKAWRPVHTFNKIPYLHQDISSLNFVIVHSPSTVFHQHLILDIMVDDGYISIFDHLLTKRINGDIVFSMNLNTELDRRQAFKTYFDIELPMDHNEHLPIQLAATLFPKSN